MRNEDSKLILLIIDLLDSNYCIVNSFSCLLLVKHNWWQETWSDTNFPGITLSLCRVWCELICCAQFKNQNKETAGVNDAMIFHMRARASVRRCHAYINIQVYTSAYDIQTNCEKWHTVREIETGNSKQARWFLLSFKFMFSRQSNKRVYIFDRENWEAWQGSDQLHVAYSSIAAIETTGLT